MEAVPHVRKLVLAGGIAVLATLGTSATAYGKGCSGNSNNPPSSVSQYVEQVPGACGSKAVNQGSQTRKVPKVIAKKIDQQGGSDATLLKEIVSSEKYGAPTQTKIKVKKVTVHKTKSTKRGGAKTILSDSEKRSVDTNVDTNPLAASVGVITDGSDGRLIALIVLMAAVAVIVVVSALRRRRVPR